MAPYKFRPVLTHAEGLPKEALQAASAQRAELVPVFLHEVDAILGDGTTATTHRVMSAVFDDDPEPLYEIILDPHADQFVRSRMCETLAMVVLRGELDRDLVGRFFRGAFMELRPQVRSFV
jgi:hypothetical protein